MRTRVLRSGSTNPPMNHQPWNPPPPGTNPLDEPVLGRRQRTGPMFRHGRAPWRWLGVLLCGLPLLVVSGQARARACRWAFPVGELPESPAPLQNSHPVGGMNLPDFGTHLGADFSSGGGCTDYGQAVYAVADVGMALVAVRCARGLVATPLQAALA